MKRLLLLIISLLALLGPQPIQGQAGNRAGLVVLFSDGSLRTSCVAFENESITSLELLQRSGVEVVAQASGGNAAVCKIGADGCDYPAEPCFCKFGAGQTGQYWAFWRLVGDTWQYSNTGAGARRISNGEVDGWAWGTGNVQSGALPPVVPFEQVCPVAAAAPEPTALPPTTAPTAVPTVQPTLRPTPRPQPSAAPAIQPTAPLAASAPPTTSVQPSMTAVPPSVTSAPPTETIQPTVSPVAPSVTTVPPATRRPVPTTPYIAGAATTTPQSRTNTGSYLMFGAMLLGLLGVIAFVVRRRAQ